MMMRVQKCLRLKILSFLVTEKGSSFFVSHGESVAKAMCIKVLRRLFHLHRFSTVQDVHLELLQLFLHLLTKLRTLNVVN